MIPVHVFVPSDHGVYHFSLVDPVEDLDHLRNHPKLYREPSGVAWRWEFTPCSYAHAADVIRDQWPKGRGALVHVQHGAQRRAVRLSRRVGWTEEIIRRVKRWAIQSRGKGH